MKSRPLPSWVAPLVTGLELGILLYLESHKPLRPPTESKVVRDVRNLVVAATAAVSAEAAEVPLALAAARWVERKRVGLLQRLPLPRALQTVLGIVLLDYTMYLWHVLAHRAPWLWRFHVVHHTDRDLDVTTALRFHFGEMGLSVPYRILQVVVLGISERAFSLWQLLFVMSILFHHSNIRLPKDWERRLEFFVMTPRIHGIHHAQNERLENSNWSSGLSIWDVIHGTLRNDVPDEDVTIGLPAYRTDDDAALNTLLKLPFESQRDAFRVGQS
jgi:sterol desaturase/sphingolipid hydroxylase (fatty acid hydroxylase superfamily)